MPELREKGKNMNHMNELGRLSLGSRMKRLSDYLITEVNAIYKANGIDFEASCFPLLTLLERRGPQTLRDAERHLGTSHSMVSQKAKYLKEHQLIDMTPCPRDARNKNLHLTQRGLELIERMRPLWKSMDIAFAKMLGEHEREIFKALGQLEQSMVADGTPLRDRVQALTSAPDTQHIRIADYSPEYHQDFCQLNLEWLEKSFVLQEFDHNVFKDPEKYILKKGGDIYMAILDGKAVGTAALYPEGDGVYELCKMGVDPRYRGHGIGRKLVEAGIERARAKGAHTLTLLTNSYKLAPAVRLYKDMGFTSIPLTPEDIKKYGEGRIDLRMELNLKTRKNQAA